MKYKIGAIACCVLSTLAPHSNAQNVPPQALPVAPCERPSWTPEALQARDFGTLKVGLLVDDTGRVLDAKLVASTQSRSLDQAGLKKAMACKFLPQYESDGKRIWMSYSFSWPYSELPAEDPLPVGASLPSGADCMNLVYPRASLRKDEQGRVTMAFLIDVDGKVVDKKLVRSSGFALLDQAALVGVAKCTFNPARNYKGPVKAWRDVVYIWTLE